MGIRAGKPGELVSGFKGYADSGGSTEFDQPFQAIVSTLPGDADVVKPPGT
jgi:hypothetical protein